MIGLIGRYSRWLHTRWPAGTVEKLPEAQPDGSTNVPGLYIVGDLTGIPLLKFSADTGARAVQTIANDSAFKKRDTSNSGVLDLAIIGGGVSGFSAALEAKKLGLSFELLEASEPFSTIVNFPKAKPIYTYPTDMTPVGEIQFHAKVKEPLVEELHAQTLEQGIKPRIARAERVTRKGGVFEVVIPNQEPLRAHRVIVGIGRSGNFRKLGVPGEKLDKVYNRLHDPKDFCGQDALVVGGGDSALETAIALATCGCRVTLSYRKPEFARPKPDNVEKINTLAPNPMADVTVEEPSSERVTTSAGPYMGQHKKPGSIRLMMASKPKEVREKEVVVTDSEGQDQTLPNDAVFSMIGREPPLDFFRRSGVRITGEWRLPSVAAMAGFMLFCFWLYHWKSSKAIPLFGKLPAWLNPDPAKLWAWLSSLSDPIAQWANDPATLLGTLKISSSGPSFYYTLAYSLIVIIFGIKRIRRRKTPYVKLQTTCLMVIQCVPLFVLPEIILPLLGHNGWFDGGALGWVTNHLFPEVSYGHGREYWRAYGLILAWPLFVYNWFTDAPLWGWLLIGALQTFVAIPAMIYFWGKGAYCGWICSCGALAETLGDTHRHKMPHGPKWNRLNMLGQVILFTAVVLMAVRIISWLPVSWNGWANVVFDKGFKGVPVVNYAWFVDLLLAGVLGYGLYFWYSGRMWCRFACPLAALMHIYARFSRFRILADKKKCISCNVCTSVCHQGIDVMNFANKGLPMEDPECVRCSACVQSCPTGVLTFGQVDRATGEVISTDRLAASPVQMAEQTADRTA